MDIIIKNSASEAASRLADIISNQILLKPNSAIGFATGRTMDAVYDKLLQLHKSNPLDCSLISGFAIDEYVGLEIDSSYSYKNYLDLHVFSPLSFDKNNIFIPNVHGQDIDKACYEYEQNIKNKGGLDLVILGIGLNGHIGMNEPGSAEDSRTRIVALTSSTRNSNKALLDEVPQTAVTMGVGTILEAKRCILLATGETKSEIIQKLVNGDISSKVPATALKQHQNFELILDQDAAKLI